jgi:hypothetical protein
MILTTNINDNMRIKTPQGKRIEEIIDEMGKNERSFALSIGYNHPSTVYAAEHGRKASPKLLKKLIDTYYEILNKKLNKNWILDGTEPKLLTIYPEAKDLSILSEDNLKIKNKCKECEKRIKRSKY